MDSFRQLHTKRRQTGRHKRGTPDRHHRHEFLTSYHRVRLSGIKSGTDIQRTRHKPQSQKLPEKRKANAFKTLFSFLKSMCVRESVCAHTHMHMHVWMDVWGGWAHATLYDCGAQRTTSGISLHLHPCWRHRLSLTAADSRLGSP